MNTEIFLNGITVEQLAKALSPLLNLQQGGQSQLSNEILTIDEVCTLLSCKRSSVYQYSKSGKLKKYGLGNRAYYKRDEVINALKPINH
ncbi:helix-turn-helix domain-containing protein [Flavobacterium sp.]|uniref:helix-turn-helix domain-containing protein n=1 Tax=Flavobacterium sp. TaxID=239 RepID=UPI003751BEAC